jgi:hypothetical protein
VSNLSYSPGNEKRSAGGGLSNPLLWLIIGYQNNVKHSKIPFAVISQRCIFYSCFIIQFGIERGREVLAYNNSNCAARYQD